MANDNGPWGYAMTRLTHDPKHGWIVEVDYFSEHALANALHRSGFEAYLKWSALQGSMGFEPIPWRSCSQPWNETPHQEASLALFRSFAPSSFSLGGRDAS